MEIKLSCPFAKYGEGLKINCTKTDGRCAHVFFKTCKGWWALSPQAEICPLRKGNLDG